MASKGSTQTRPRSGSSTRSSGTRKPPAKKPAHKTHSRASSTRRPPQGPGLVARSVHGVALLVRALIRAVVGILTLIAHAIGGASRAAGSGAKEIDPAHRRDGLGLLLLAGALVSAGGAWWQAGGAGEQVDELLTAILGKGALLLPVLLAYGAWRVLRHPDGKGASGRLVIGWGALALGALGVVHVVKGDIPGDEKGGLVGFLLGSPLEQGLTAWLAVPVLFLLAVFGLLVVTATPIHQVPDVLRALRDKALRREKPEEPKADEPLPPLEPLRRRGPR